MTDDLDTAPLETAGLDELAALRAEFSRFMLQYQFGIDEVTTKIGILREEFRHLHDYNPIEHVTSRLKAPESIITKVARRGCDPSFEAIRRTIRDIAGVRVVCSFASDVYRFFDMLTGQSDLTLLRVKDYIAQPKPNGYRSLHALVDVPVFLSDTVVPITVEVQFRTIAMDFWASLEHKIHYKYQGDVPDDVRQELCDAAETAHHLDEMMADLHQRVRGEQETADSAATIPRSTVPTDDVLKALRAIRAVRQLAGIPERPRR